MGRPWTARLSAAALAAVLGGAPSLATAQDSPARFSLSPGIVVDREAMRIFVIEPGDVPQVGAIDAVGGKLLWASDAAVRPVDVTQNHEVLCLGEVNDGQAEIGALLLTGESGEVTMRAPLEAPQGAIPSPAAAATSDFKVSAVTTDDESVIRWEYRPVERLRALPQRTLNALPKVADAAPAVGAGAAPDGVLRGATSVNLSTGATQPADEGVPISFAPGVAAAADEPLLPDVPGPKYLSADGRHVMARRRTKGESHRFELIVHDRASGERVGGFPSDASYVPFYIEDSRIVLQAEASVRREGDGFVERPRQVQALELATGDVAWEHPIAEMQFRGPPPP